MRGKTVGMGLNVQHKRAIAMFRTTLSALALAAAVGSGSSVCAIAQQAVPDDVVEAVTDGDRNRYSLVSSGQEVLRVDRQSGTVSVCSRLNETWRCNPVPLAEEAYLAEINDLAFEVDRLSARLRQLEGEGTLLDEPEAENPAASGNEELEPDEELEKALDFTENAMRRLFGMVRELQRQIEGGGEDGN